MRRTPFVLIVVLLMTGFGSSADAGGGAASPGRALTVQTEPDGWTLRYNQTHIPSASLTIDGSSHLLFTSAPAAVMADSGSPQLPLETVSLGVPFGSAVTMELVDPVYQESANQLVAPVPRYRRTAEGDHAAIYIKDAAAYNADRFYPARTLWSDPPFIFRQQQIITIHIAPVLYNPSKKILKRLLSGGIRIRSVVRGPATLQMPGPATGGTDAHCESVYRSLILNYDQAKQWRRPGPAGLSATGADPTRDWFNPGATYYRIPVVADGWYRLAPNDIANAGGLIDTGTASLWYRGNRIPLVVRNDSSVEFYANRNYGDSTYSDWYTDTSSYWLSWGGPPGRRFTSLPASGAAATTTLRSVVTTVHQEQNNLLYQGTDESELTNSGAIPGKGWGWEFYFASNQYTHTFTLDSIDQTATTAVLRVRLFSTTPHYKTPDHIARFWMNDSLVGSVSFNGRTEGRFSASFPARWLVNGTNRLRILSDVPPSSNVNQFYLDWFEVDYNRLLHTDNDQLVFLGPASSGGGSTGFTVTGFRNSSIEVFDLQNGRQIPGGVVSGSPGAGYSVAFQDTLSAARRYAVVAAGAGLPVLPLSRNVITDIRSNPAGADYIIITHRDFMTAARQLAAFRRTTNNVRVTIVDVQDIYDQFNYGMLNAETIKAFLRYAYTSWALPAPTYLVMLGDASWDYHRYLPTTVKTNYVPAYGVPGGDNWFTCFDSAYPFIPSMLAGRLPVQDSIQAGKVVAKIMRYESSAPAEWTKKFLFISGGTSAGEQSDFNSRNDFTLNTYVVPPPVGGFGFRVYKSTPDAIDGEHKQQLQDILNNGVVFVNFLGHSGGRVWGVDVGSPDDLQNTNGELPFVSSVSCNVGAFSEPSSNVLSEDFVLADNRGSSGFWASASLAYASVGSSLVNSFFRGLTVDTLRDFGTLTTTARINVWRSSGSNYITIGSVNLTPLLGDPLSHFAVPVKPDLAVSPSDIYLNSRLPTPADSVITLTALVHNYGLVPSDSVSLLLTDIYNGVSTPLLNNTRIGPTRFRDSLAVPWRGTKQIGMHTFQMSIDPAGGIDEVTKTNNVASAVAEVYANQLYVVRPLGDMLVAPGPQLLRVTSPIGVDSATMQIMFQIDTSGTFSSPALMTSPAVNPGPVSAEWTTPSLADGTLYYWRARSFSSTITNAWVTSSFRTGAPLPPSPLVRWSESSRAQFLQGVTNRTAVTDSGVTIGAQNPSRLYARSLGYRADANKDYYSILKLDDQTMFGLWWVQGTGFLSLRVDPVTRAPVFRAFDVPGTGGQADSMQAFINGTPPGDFIALSVIYDGRTNMTAGLRSSIKSLGATLIDSVQPGDAWSIIAQAGGGTPPLEHWSRSSVTADSLILQNAYSAGSGTYAGIVLPMPQRWQTFHWTNEGPAVTTNARAAIVGIRSNGTADTLRSIPRDSSVADLSGLNIAAADPSYVSFRAVTSLSTADGRSTPLLRNWSADFEPPADLAISSHTLTAPKIQIPKNVQGSVTLAVYNIGYRKADSARVILSYILPDNSLRPIAYATVDSIPVGGWQTVQIGFPTAGLPTQFTLQARVVPPASAKELIWENNVTLYNFTVQPGIPLTARMRIFSDGVQLIDGDYVAARPTILVHLYDLGGVGTVPPAVDLYVDNVRVGSPAAGLVGESAVPLAAPLDDPTFAPTLANGTHELRIRVSQQNVSGTLDTVVQSLTVNVTDQYKILQMFNYPNPFGADTWFTLVVTGNTPPEELTVRIYTVAGRKIREIKSSPGSLQVGFNRVYWDGRDAQGDEVANGYYLYQVQITGGGKSLTATSKLARVR
jgi:hypothetical protein